MFDEYSPKMKIIFHKGYTKKAKRKYKQRHILCSGGV